MSSPTLQHGYVPPLRHTQEMTKPPQQEPRCTRGNHPLHFGLNLHYVERHARPRGQQSSSKDIKRNLFT
ncbi:hypothetical protein TNCV_5062471 [Trichonephila clavipes]|nr:hypothetical protein TNCV_5062471 [Trichonephila clavipes]